MDWPPTTDDISNLIDDFIAEAFPTLMAIIAIAAYSGFVFMFYRLLARRDILSLDLSKYDQTMTGKIRAFFRTAACLIQYALAIPILIAFWTVVMAVILTLLADGNDHARNALIATSVVGSVRILSYWTEDLSRDVAKMLPFAVLGVFLVGSTSVEFNEFEQLVENRNQLAHSYINSLILLSILETILRIYHGLRELVGGQRRVNKKLKKIAKQTGRSKSDIREDMLDDGILNYSTFDDDDEEETSSS